MDTFYKDLDKAISRLKVDCEKIKELLAEGTSYGTDLDREIDDIREEAYELIDSCDANEDVFEYLDDDIDYIDIED